MERALWAAEAPSHGTIFQTSLFKSWKNTFIFVPSHNFQSPRNAMRWPARATKNWHVWANLPQETPQHLDAHIPKEGPQSSAEGFWPGNELKLLFWYFLSSYWVEEDWQSWTEIQVNNPPDLSIRNFHQHVALTQGAPRFLYAAVFPNQVPICRLQWSKDFVCISMQHLEHAIILPATKARGTSKRYFLF